MPSRFKESFYATREKIWAKKRERLKLHHSFKRSYREDYVRGLQAPGLVAHAMSTLKILFKNWRLFGLLILVVVAMNILFVGLMSEETYQTVQDSIDESRGFAVRRNWSRSKIRLAFDFYRYDRRPHEGYD